MGGTDDDELDAASPLASWQLQDDELRWAISSTRRSGDHDPSAPPSRPPGRAGHGDLGGDPIGALLPDELVRGVYRADQVDAAAVARQAQPRPGHEPERRALALFVGAGRVVLTSNRIVVVLGSGRSVRGPFGPSTLTQLTASLPLEYVSRLVLGPDTAGAPEDRPGSDALWILVETVQTTMLSLELHRAATDEDQLDPADDRTIFDRFVAVTVARLRSSPRSDTPRSVLDRAVAGTWDREGDDLVVTLTDRPLEPPGS